MIEWYLETAGEDNDLSLCIPLNEFREYTVGRKRGYDIVSSNPLVSRNHGVITVRHDNSVYVKDLNSSNGIWVNDVKIPPQCDHLLSVNDLIGIGSPSNAQEQRKELFRIQCRRLTESKASNSSDVILIGDTDSPFEREVESCSFDINKIKVEKDIEDNQISNRVTLALSSGCNSSSSVDKMLVRNSISDVVRDTKEDVEKVLSKANSFNEKTFGNISGDEKENINANLDLRKNSFKAREVENKDKDEIFPITTSSSSGFSNNNNAQKQRGKTCEVKELKESKESNNTKQVKHKKHEDEISKGINTRSSVTELSSSNLSDSLSSKASSEKIVLSGSNLHRQSSQNCLKHLPVQSSSSDKTPLSSQSPLGKLSNFSNFLQTSLNQKYPPDKTSNCRQPSSAQNGPKNSAMDEVSNFPNNLQPSTDQNYPSDSVSKIPQQSYTESSSDKLPHFLQASSSKNSDLPNKLQPSTNQNCPPDKVSKLPQSSSTENSSDKIPHFLQTSFVNNFRKNSLLDTVSKCIQSSSLETDYAVGKCSSIYHSTPVKSPSPDKFQPSVAQNSTAYKTDLELSVVVKTEKIDDFSFNQDKNVEMVVISDSELPVVVKTEAVDKSFSSNQGEIDIVVVSDDEDIFPKSQLFGDDIVKTEPGLSQNCSFSKKEESAVEDDCILTSFENDDIFSMIKNEVDVDYDILPEEEEESDDDSLAWFNKLSQSEEKLSASQLFDELKRRDDETARTEPSDNDDNSSKRHDELLKLIGESSGLEEFKEKEVRDTDKPSSSSDMTDGGSNLKRFNLELKSDLEEKASSATAVAEKSPTEENLQASSSSADKPREKSSKKSYVKPPVIEAPFLVKGKRKAHEESKPKSVVKDKRRKSSHDDASSTSSVSNTAVPVSSMYGDKSIKLQFDKRNKKKSKTDTITKYEKQQIQDVRRQKLKEIAKPTENREDNKAPKIKTKPKVKVSSSRGLFLTDSELDKKEPEKKEAEKQAEKKGTDRKKKTVDVSENEPEKKKRYVIPKKKNDKAVNEKSDRPSSAYSKTRSQPVQNGENSNLGKNLHNVDIPQDRKMPSTSKGFVPPTNSLPDIIKIQSSNAATGQISSAAKLTNSVPLSGITPVQKKRVRFVDKPQVQYFEVEDGNTLRKCVNKDAPLPRRNVEIPKPVAAPACPTEQDTLTKILKWVPIWLEEQKNIESSPKVTEHVPLQMLHTFNSPRDYYDIVTPLLLLELWKSIFRDWIHVRTPVQLACIDHIENFQKENFLLKCHCVMSRNEPENFPGRGDFLVVEILLNDGKEVTKKFAYVTDLTKRRLIKSDIINRNLIQNELPEFIINFTMMTKFFTERVWDQRLIRVRVVSRLGPYLRIFRSVSCLYKSPLCNLILKPNIADYKVPKPTTMTLAITDKLDGEQMMCVLEACNICTRKEPGIYMIQGPPGTGKSLVIKNIVRQLLFGGNKPGSAQKRQCILLCAPSNGAVDELALKLLEMRKSLPHNERIKMIRIGPPNSITHPLVKSISVADLLEKELRRQQINFIQGNSALADEHRFLISKVNKFENVLVTLQERGEGTREVLDKLNMAKAELDVFKTRVARKDLTFQQKKQIERDMETNIYEKANVVCTTLSSCMSSRMEELYTKKKIQFTCCIVDEATQSNEQVNLIPLMLGINKMVLVGDSAQLPATVLSQEARNLGYGNSLFSRIQSCLEHFPENPIRMMSLQFRMHPEICQFPSEHFYSNKLKTSDVVLKKKEHLLLPYLVFSLNFAIDVREHEYINKAEANFVLLVVSIILRRTGYNIGIITPYTKQREYFQRKLNELKAKDPKETREKEEKETGRVVVNTVDGFQGQERDVIIISCVRYTSNTFLADHQRLNVALTRAKHSVFICAHSQLFLHDTIWRTVEMDARNRQLARYLTERDTLNENYVMSLICK